MADKKEKNISRRKKRRYKRRMKKGFKVSILIFVTILLLAVYFGYAIFVSSHSPNLFGEIDADDPFLIDDDSDVDEEDIPEESASYEVLSVADGEAILIKYKETEILVDTGSETGAEKLIKSLDGKIEGDIEFLILSNGSEKRTGGLVALSEKYRTSRTIIGDLGENGNNLMRVIVGMSDRVSTGKSIVYDIAQNVTLSVIKPEVASQDPMDRSLVTFFIFHDQGCIALSDAGKEEASKALEQVGDRKLEVMVLPRFGDYATYKSIDSLASVRYYAVSTPEALPEKLAKILRRSVSTTRYGNIKYIMTERRTEIDSENEKAKEEAEKNAAAKEKEE